MHQLSISESGHQQLCEVGHLRSTQLLTSLCAPGFTGLAVSELPLSSVASQHTGFKSDELIHYSKKRQSHKSDRGTWWAKLEREALSFL